MIGETIGNFKIVSRLGRGGMGEVWLAEQQSIGTKVAIKLLNAGISEDTEHVQRFFNEARAVSRIQHAGIVKIFDVGHHGGHAYLIMEYLEGETLAQRIAHAKRIPLADLCEIGRQAASVLDATHSAGITHRDLKPDNIFVVPDRELARGYRVKILDFGIAKLTGTLANVSPRTTGTMGTPAYMAPEQWGDASKVDWRADLYSLGCVTFEMACGRPPFIVSNIAEACAKHLHDPPPHVHELAPELPAALDALVDRLLAKSPAARAGSMREVEHAFTAIGSGQPLGLAETMPSGTAPPSAIQRAPATTEGRTSATALPTTRDTPPRRYPTFLILGALVILAITALAAMRMMRQPRMPITVSRDHRESVHDRDSPQDAAVLVASAPPDAAVAPPSLADAAVVAVVAVDAGAGSSPSVHTPPKTPAKPPVKEGKPPVKEGTIDADAVLQATMHDVGIRKCYETAVRKDPTLGGKLTANAWIDETGRATKVTATGISDVVERCIERRILAIRFPKPVGGPVNLYIPFSFVPPPPEDVAKGGTIVVKDAESELRVTPTLDELKASLAKIQPQLDDCGHGAKGRVELHITPQGRATAATVGGALANTDTGHCVEQAIVTHARFPESKGGVTLIVGFHLTK